MNEVTSPSFFSTAKVALGSGAEAASPTLVGPGLAGVIVITPSIPDSPAEGLCPVETQTAMTMTPKTVRKLRDLTAHYIHEVSWWSMNRNPNES
jgi:hypothetical protein